MSGNTAYYAGGGISGGYGSAVTLTGSTVADNSTISGFGGGISGNAHCEITLTNSTLSGNSTAGNYGRGGGIGGLVYNFGPVTLTSVAST